MIVSTDILSLHVEHFYMCHQMLYFGHFTCVVIRFPHPSQKHREGT